MGAGWLMNYEMDQSISDEERNVAGTSYCLASAQVVLKILI